MKAKKISNEFQELSKQIDELQAKREALTLIILESAKKPVLEWCREISISKLKDVLKNTFAIHSNKYGGTDYFAWSDSQQVQLDFEKFVKELLKSPTHYFYDERSEIFFSLKKATTRCTTRSQIVDEKYESDSNGNFVYRYNGTTYHGFGSIDSTVQQVLIINPTNFKVVKYEDSTKRYFGNSTSGHNLKTSFIDALVKHSRTYGKLNKKETLYLFT